MPDTKMLSVEEAATVLDVLPQTVRKWAATDPPRIAAEKIGRAWIVKMDAPRFAAAVVTLSALRARELVLQSRRPPTDPDVQAAAIVDALEEHLGDLPEHLRDRTLAAARTVFCAALEP